MLRMMLEGEKSGNRFGNLRLYSHLLARQPHAEREDYIERPVD